MHVVPHFKFDGVQGKKVLHSAPLSKICKRMSHLPGHFPSLFRLFVINLHKISPVKVAKHHTMVTLTGLVMQILFS